MRCEICNGTGMQRASGVAVPCVECGGCGVAHCCDGLQACGEVDGDERLMQKPASISLAALGKANQEISDGLSRKTRID
jgi:hypothetical protein